MGADSMLEFDFALFGQDFLDVTGAATLNGTIDVTKLGSFTPADGTEYTILSAADGITDLGVRLQLADEFLRLDRRPDRPGADLPCGVDGDFNGDGLWDLHGH